MKTDKKDPRAALSNVAHAKRSFHTNVLALRMIVDNLGCEIMRAFTNQEAIVGTDGYRPSNVSSAMNALTDTAAARNFVTAKTLLEVVEDSQMFKDSSAVIDPILTEIAVVEAEEERQRQEQSQNEEALRQAEEVAKNEALASVKQHPAVVAARNKLGRA